MATAPTRFIDFTDLVQDAFDNNEGPNAPSSVAANAYALGRYLRLSSMGMPTRIDTPARGPSYGCHFYVNDALAYVTVQHGNDAPMVFVRT